MMNNYYTNPFTFIISSLSGIYFILFISKKIDSMLSDKNLFKKFLCFLGKSTFIVLSIHLLCFKIITLLEIFIYKTDWFYLACYPVFKVNGIWSLLYTLIGLFIPLALKNLYHKLKNIKCKM